MFHIKDLIDSPNPKIRLPNIPQALDNSKSKLKQRDIQQHHNITVENIFLAISLEILITIIKIAVKRQHDTFFSRWIEIVVDKGDP